MIQVNDNFIKLPGNYLFSSIAKKVNAFKSAHPEAALIRLGIGDVTRPLHTDFGFRIHVLQIEYQLSLPESPRSCGQCIEPTVGCDGKLSGIKSQ